ncbi:cobalamin B12-binding domain-containing protein [Piscibacillus halophilus]|uniref:Methylmalonyl-CoA mutase, C-terminal domain n=1 Tax=Piscibacillus halophilus TaxID=571933 RepID=A0A1H9A4Z4_9BACI|nr:methylmalonyl-CoA mutase, C-terminal domain [Piscibacillus halophilus]
MDQKIRVLIAKPGLDGHDRGALVIAQALRDSGMEVIYTGLRQSAQQIAQAAIQEDVDVVGLSSLSGGHKALFPKVVEELKLRGAEDIPVIGGGVIPDDDVSYLEEKGVHKIFTSGTPTTEIAEYIKKLVRGEVV